MLDFKELAKIVIETPDAEVVDIPGIVDLNDEEIDLLTAEIRKLID